MRSLLLLVLVACAGPATTDDTGTGPIACGAALTCGGGAVCVQEAFAPSCQTRLDTAVACPEGTTESMCGGAGMPCCCAPAPPMTYRCYEPAGCGTVPACDCVQAACSPDKQCMGVTSETSGIFRCEEPAAP